MNNVFRKFMSVDALPHFCVRRSFSSTHKTFVPNINFQFLEPIYRQLPPHPNQHHQYGKNMQVPLFGPNNYAYMQNTIQQQMLCNANLTPYGTQRFPKNQQNINQKVMQRNTGAPGSNFQKNNGYQLKVGGVVVGSWSNGSKNQPARMNNRNGMVRIENCSIEISRNFFQC